MAADARAAVLARVVMGLREDAEALERGVAAQRRPQRFSGARLRWAMAASLGAMAVLFGALQLNPSASSDTDAVGTTRAEQILTSSFESTGADSPATADSELSTAVFSAGFDS